MNNLKDIELIDQYLNGALSDKDAHAFSERLLQEPELNTLLADVQASEELFKMSELAAIQTQLNKYDYSAGNKGLSKTTLSIIGFAIVSAGIIGASLLYERKEVIATSATPASPAPAAILPEPENKTEVQQKTAKNISRLSHNNVSANNTIAEIHESAITNLSAPEVSEHVPAPTIVTPKVAENAIPAINCGEQIKVSWTADPTCNNASDGIISITEISGGQAPYSLALNNQPAIKGSAKSFEHLSAGFYNITLTDASNCIKALNKIEVKAKNCNTVIHKTEKPVIRTKNHLIYASEQSWKIPDCPEKGLLEIKNQQGTVVYSNEIIADNNDTWNLMESNGSIITTGIYFYRLVNLETKAETIGTITVVQ